MTRAQLPQQKSAVFNQLLLEDGLGEREGGGGRGREEGRKEGEFFWFLFCFVFC